MPLTSKRVKVMVMMPDCLLTDDCARQELVKWQRRNMELEHELLETENAELLEELDTEEFG